jgi:4-amino-4-deoxy-L-arabinose transferase-like glycosyltransferase
MSDTRRIPVTEPWPNASRETRAVIAAISAFVAVAAALRFWSLGGGLPSSLGVDEPQIMVRALAMVRTADYNPHFFDYPGLYLYVQACVVVVRFLAGASAGQWASLAQVTDYDFYLWGRAVTALFGTASVYLVYRAGLRWGPRQALVAAAVFAVVPIHVRESHFVLTDVPMTFFVVLAFVLALRALEMQSPMAFAWAGAAAGLAAGTKYTAWVAVLMPLLATLFADVPVTARVRIAIATVAGFLVAFLAAAPYTVLDLPGFLNGFGALAAAVPMRSASQEPGWLIYLKHLRIALGWPGSALAAGGLALFAWRAVMGPSRARYAMVLLFLVVFWSMIAERALIFARYLLPAVPFACLLLAIGAVAAADWLGKTRTSPKVAPAALVAIVIAALVVPTASSFAFGRQFGLRSTDMLAIDWIREHVQPGARIIHEGASLHFPANRYQLEYVRTLTERSLDFYLGGTVDYVVATSATYEWAFRNPQRYQAECVAYRNLFHRLTPAFSAYPSASHPGPEIRVFTVPR